MSSNKKPLFMVGLPTNGEHSFLFTQFMLGTAWPVNFGMEFRAVPGQEVGDARNILVQEAVNIGCKYIMFIDEDVIGPQNGVIKLLYLMENHPEWTMAGGVYPTKSIPPQPLIFTEWAQGAYWGWKMGELVKVLGAGCGFNMFRVSDLVAMTEPKEYERRNPWNGTPMVVREWFKTSAWYTPSDKGMIREGHTEDSWFYMMAERAGLQCWIDTSVWCRHYDKTTGAAFEVPTESMVAKKPEPWTNSPRQVNLGAGGNLSPYEINVDLRTGPLMNFRADVRQLPDDWGGQFDHAHADHVLEHMSWVDTLKVLSEWVRILKPGGTLEINVPDLKVAFDLLADDKYTNQLWGMIYGDQGHEMWNQGPYGGYDPAPAVGDEYPPERFLPHSFEHNAHKAGFTASYLGKLLWDAGLEAVEAETAGYNLKVVGRKPELDAPAPEVAPIVVELAPEAAQDGAASPAAEAVIDGQTTHSPEPEPA